METINLKDYRKSGEGANGSSYDSVSDPSVMVKLYNTDYPTETISFELEVARKVYEIGVPSPEPGTLVTDGERIGIRFRRITGKRSFSRMLADEPDRVEEYGREFARYCRRLHSIRCPEGLFPDAKEQFLHLLSEVKSMSADEKAVMADFIRSVPDSDCALHGDMHIGNVISTLPKGVPTEAEHDVYFIDLGYFSHGFPLFDLGMMMNICLFCDEDFRRHDFHVTGELTAKLWEYFVDEYFFSGERLAEKYFGPGQTLESINKALLPYVCCKFLLVEYNLGFLPPHYRKLVEETFHFSHRTE